MSIIEVTESDGDIPLHVSIGDELRIRLTQSGGTGFVWSAAPLPASLAVHSDEVSPSLAAPGSAGTRVIRLVAAQVGRGTVDLTLSRPWPGGETDRQLSFDVTVS